MDDNTRGLTSVWSSMPPASAFRFSASSSMTSPLASRDLFRDWLIINMKMPSATWHATFTETVESQVSFIEYKIWLTTRHHSLSDIVLRINHMIDRLAQIHLCRSTETRRLVLEDELRSYNVSYAIYLTVSRSHDFYAIDTCRRWMSTRLRSASWCLFYHER